MSLSNNAAQSKPLTEGYRDYQMESFDTANASSAGRKELSVFEAFWNDDESEEEPFQYVPSDGRIIVEKAKREAEKLFVEAKNRVATIEQEAYEKGYCQGEKDGKEMGAQKLEKVMDKIYLVFEEMVSCRTEFRRLYEKETLDLICRIAERVVRARVEMDNTVVREAIFEAFNLAADRTDVKIKVNPGDIEYVKDLRPRFFERITELKTVTMESDPSVGSGGCMMETAFGHVDARVESQLEKITAAVKEAFEATPEELVTEKEE